jgi:hypothetical protein
MLQITLTILSVVGLLLLGASVFYGVYAVLNKWVSGPLFMVLLPTKENMAKLAEDAKAKPVTTGRFGLLRKTFGRTNDKNVVDNKETVDTSS